MKTTDYIMNGESFLVVTRKFSMKKLLKQIIQCGGHTPKYELYVPGASPIPDFSNKGANDNDLVILD